jgi:hypothetical protein
MPYTTTWTKNGVIWTYFGVLTGEEALRSNIEIYGDERFDELNYQIVDFRDVTENQISDTDTKKIAYLDRAAATTNPRIRVAIVLKNEDCLNTAEVYRELSKTSPWQLKVCTSIEEAQTWIQSK